MHVTVYCFKDGGPPHELTQADAPSRRSRTSGGETGGLFSGGGNPLHFVPRIGETSKYRLALLLKELTHLLRDL